MSDINIGLTLEVISIKLFVTRFVQLLYEFRTMMNGKRQGVRNGGGIPLMFVGCICVAISTERLNRLALCGPSYGIS